ncbi:MAG: AMP-binding protein [Humibacillus sp.]|nr:AMP-binding protein [Humibacillus sp.]MDN5777107.1 AMP-binding protein [Humibacillus sp.]
MSVYAERPWLARYTEGRPSDIRPEFSSVLALFQASLARDPDAVAIRYFDGSMTLAQLDDASNALASSMLDHAFAAGDRLAIYVQNDPCFVVGLLAAWKAGGAAVAVNPMNKQRELTYLLEDSGASALLTLDELYDGVAREVIADGTTRVQTVFTASALDGQTRNDPRLFMGLAPTHHDTLDLATELTSYAGQAPPPVQPDADDLAILSYTSGTTGVPKGALNTHGNIVFNAQTYRDWVGLQPSDGVLAIAPLFHITGLVGHVAIALLLPSPLVLTHRFHPDVMLDSLREHRPAFTVGAITAFIALTGADGVTPHDFSSLKAVYSGGAPIAPAVQDQLEAKMGAYVHNIYGLTETNSPSHAVPFGQRAPVDPDSGALSVGVPTFNTTVRVVDEVGTEVPIGQIGEFLTTGPQVVPGYWNKPEATAESIPGGELHTGDVGFMDQNGWFYVVDRKKDMINAAGYKVWPREVEDVLYGHPAVEEAAVVGVPDEYRGESVRAFVSLKPGASATPEEIIEYCRANMAAYKYPRSVKIVEELPKTVTGKILRRELRGT